MGEEVETFMRLELGTDSYSLLTRLWQRLSLPLTDWLITGQGSDTKIHLPPGSLLRIRSAPSDVSVSFECRMIYTEEFCTACTLTQPVVTPHLRPNGLWACL